MFTDAKNILKSNIVSIMIYSVGFLFSILGGILVSKVYDSTIFGLAFLGAFSFFYLINKNIYIGIGIFIGTMIFDYSIIPLFSQNASISKMIGILILGLCLVKLIIEQKNFIPKDRKFILIAIFFLWSLSSLLYVKNIELGLARIITLFQLILTYIILFSIINNKKALSITILTVTIIGTFVSIGSIISIIQSPETLIHSVSGIERYEGTAKDPNMFAQNFLVILPFYLFFYLNKSSVVIVAILMFIFVLISTYSRGAMLGLTIVMILSIPLIVKTKNKRFLFISLSILILVASVHIFNKNDALKTRVTSSGRGSSTQTRLELLEVAIDMGVNNLLTGVGLGNFIEHSSEYGSAFHIQRESHNGFIDVFATLGMPGFIIFLYIIYLCVKDFWIAIKTAKSVDKELTNLFQFVLISFISILITGFFLGLIFVKMFWVLVSFSSVCKNIAIKELAIQD